MYSLLETSKVQVGSRVMSSGMSMDKTVSELRSGDMVRTIFGFKRVTLIMPFIVDAFWLIHMHDGSERRMLYGQGPLVATGEFGAWPHWDSDIFETQAGYLTQPEPDLEALQGLMLPTFSEVQLPDAPFQGEVTYDAVKSVRWVDDKRARAYMLGIDAPEGMDHGLIIDKMVLTGLQ